MTFFRFLSTLCLLAGGLRAADLTVVVKDVHSADGAVLIAIYDSDTHFMDPRHAKFTNRTKASKGEVTFVFHNVPAGKYAISCFHDENGNSRLDTNAMGIPTEGYGFSNDAHGVIGPASFVQAAFDFDGKGNKSIAFSLNY